MPIIFQDSFLVSGIMCHSGCGATVEGALKRVDDLIHEGLIPEDSKVSVDANPQALGVHRLIILIESNVSPHTPYTIHQHRTIADQLKVKLTDIGFEVIDTLESTPPETSLYIHWMNILINTSAIIGAGILSAMFTPSIPLTLGLLVLCFATTALTSRSYLIGAYYNLRSKNLANMSTSVAMGWLLSLAHALYHTFNMSMIMNFGMVFMNFIMPIVLITIINGMDEVKRLVLNKSKTMHLSNIRSVFPNMASAYLCYQLSHEKQTRLIQLLDSCAENEQSSGVNALITELLNDETPLLTPKQALKKDGFIVIKPGECFPVDGVIVQGQALIDGTILTGESRQHRQFLDVIPAGAINMGQTLIIRAREDSYNSTVNKLLFRANRAEATPTPQAKPRVFNYVYAGLIFTGVIASIMTPLVLGIITIPLVLQNIMGILFAICPCTLTIAHQLPQLLSNYQRNQNGILLRHDQLTEPFSEVETIVFDKTGTLTTGNSLVDSSEGISSASWQRIYLLEKLHGAEHPLARALCHHYETTGNALSLIQDIHSVWIDSKSRGLSAMVQGTQIHIGSADFLERANIALPKHFSTSIKTKIAQGHTLLYVAENNIYQGIITIKHEVRDGILPALFRLKNAGTGKRLIMLTGDSALAAAGFNQQNGFIFEPHNIHSEQTPQDKENFLKHLMTSTQTSRNTWFVGDGLNDAPCARIVTENGGVSFAMTATDKAAFFSDISLNGSLDYLFQHNPLNQFIKKNIKQNQAVMIYGAVSVLAFIITCSIAGVAVSPLISMLIMVSTTLLTLFNSYRVTLSVDCALNKNASWIKRWLASDMLFALVIGASALFALSLLISTVASGGLALVAISSVLQLTSSLVLGSVAVLMLTHLIQTQLIPLNTADTVEDKTSTTAFSPSHEQHALTAYQKPVAPLTFNVKRHSIHQEQPLPNDAERHALTV